MIRVYHGPDLFVLRSAHLEDQALCTTVSEALKDYHCVAEVATDDPDEAYRLTNTIHESWWVHPKVRFFGSLEHGMKGARSTCIADVLERENDELLVVSRFGFTDLARPEGFTARPR